MYSEVSWSRLYPKEWMERVQSAPLVYLPVGLCEPHGQISAFGLDLIKAEHICEQAAKRTGGVVAPSLGYHIHESGYHARWLEENIGEINPLMTGMPPHVVLYFFLYQLRAFSNAGFRAIVVLSGHGGGNQEDLRHAAELFMNRFPVQIWVGTDGDLVKDKYRADHAGQFEISQLMDIDPALIDMQRVQLEGEPHIGGKFARADSSELASSELGAAINEACIVQLCHEAASLLSQVGSWREPACISYDEIEHLWSDLSSTRQEWVTAKPKKNQDPVSEDSRWKPYEYPYGHDGE